MIKIIKMFSPFKWRLNLAVIKKAAILGLAVSSVAGTIGLNTNAYGQGTKAKSSQRVSIYNLIAQRQFKVARQLTAIIYRDDPKKDIRMNHLEGLIDIKSGRYESAKKRFRDNLAKDPNFWQSRDYLAKILLRQGDAEGFNYHANIITSGPINEGLKDAYIRTLARTSHGKPWGFQTRFSILPSTNINRGSGHETFTLNGRTFVINDGSKNKSGVGFSAGITGFVKKQLGERDSLAFIVSADMNKYSETELNDQFVLGSKISYTHSFTAGSFSIGPQVKYQWDAWEPSKLSYGAFANASYRFSGKTALYVNLNYWQHEYTDADYNDGYSYDGSLSLNHQFNNKFGVSLTGAFSRDIKEQLPHLSNLDASVALGVNKEWEGGAITSIFGKYGERQFDGVFPLHGYARKDEYFSVGAKFKHRKFSYKGFAPELRYEYTHQKSNVKFYDYNSHDFSISLTKAF